MDADKKIQAVGHRVIVRPDAVVTKSKGGIMLAIDEKREQASAQKGTVISIGEMAWKNAVYGYGIEGWKPWCNLGDRVYFARYAGKTFRDEDDPDIYFVVLNDEDIQCLVVKETIGADNSTDE